MSNQKTVAQNATTVSAKVKDFESFDFTGMETLPAKKQVSELAQITQGINRSVEGEVRGLSSYFKTFRKQGKELAQKMKLYNAKGRTFDPVLCHEIINLGNIKLVTDGSDKFEAARSQKLGDKYKPFNGVWTSNRLQAVFFFVVETTPKKPTK